MWEMGNMKGKDECAEHSQGNLCKRKNRKKREWTERNMSGRKNVQNTKGNTQN